MKNSVIAKVGARPAARDAVDTRILKDFVNRAGRIIDSQRDVGGFPVLPKNTRAFIVSNPSGDDDKDGYTNVEEVLHKMASDVE